MTYHCLDCDEEFDEPECEEAWYHSDYIGHGGWYPERTAKCPYCGSEDFEECSDRCEVCGEKVYKTISVNYEELCPECYEKLKAIMEETVDKITAELDIDSLHAQHLTHFYEED